MMNSRSENDYIQVVKSRKLGASSHRRNLTKIEEEPTSLFDLKHNSNDQVICVNEECKKCKICLFEYT